MKFKVRVNPENGKISFKVRKEWKLGDWEYNALYTREYTLIFKIMTWFTNFELVPGASQVNGLGLASGHLGRVLSSGNFFGFYNQNYTFQSGT